MNACGQREGIRAVRTPQDFELVTRVQELVATFVGVIFDLGKLLEHGIPISTTLSSVTAIHEHLVSQDMQHEFIVVVANLTALVQPERNAFHAAGASVIPNPLSDELLARFIKASEYALQPSYKQ